MRSLIVVTILCLTSTSSFACVFDTDCKPGIMCVAGACRDLLSGSGDDNVPAKRPTGKTCGYDGDCSQGVLTLSMSAFKGKADIPSSLANVCS